MREPAAEDAELLPFFKATKSTALFVADVLFHTGTGLNSDEAIISMLPIPSGACALLSMDTFNGHVQFNGQSERHQKDTCAQLSRRINCGLHLNIIYLLGLRTAMMADGPEIKPRNTGSHCSFFLGLRI